MSQSVHTMIISCLFFLNHVTFCGVCCHVTLCCPGCGCCLLQWRQQGGLLLCGGHSAQTQGPCPNTPVHQGKSQCIHTHLSNGCRASLTSHLCFSYLARIDTTQFDRFKGELCWIECSGVRSMPDEPVLVCQVPELGLLQLSTLPDTCLQASQPPAFAAGGLHIQPLVPMKQWKLAFDGNMT